MPIYEYECETCGTIEEVLQKFSDRPLKKCRHCSGMVHKLVSQSSFHLKGSGWYVTDYAGKKAKTDAATQPKGEAGSDKTEKKPSSPDNTKSP